MLRLSSFVVFAASTVACAGRTTPSPVGHDEQPAPTAAEATPERVPSKRPARLVVPSKKSAPAPWAEAVPGRALTLDDLGGSAFFLGASDDYAAVWSRFGVFLGEHERGVVARLDLPKGADWVGFDERGALAGGGGCVWRADDPRGAWTRVATLEGADQFDASVGSIVASDGKMLWVSTDGGASFTTRETPLHRIENLLTRPDGAIVVQGADASDLPTTVVSGPGSKRWERTETEWLYRVGGQIREGEGGDRALSRDGRKWLSTCVDGLVDYDTWLSTYASPEPGPAGTAVTLRSPKAPTKQEGCDTWGLLGGLGMGGADGPEPVRGTTGAEPPPTGHLAGFLSDGICNADPDGFCEDGPIVRLPHVVRVDGEARTAKVFALPTVCDRPARIDNAFGASVLTCDVGSEVAVFTLDDRGWHEEGRLPISISDAGSLTAAGDGTMLLHGRCTFDRACAPSFVRHPVALGEDGAWHRLASSEALAYRVLTGGRVLRISGTHATEYELAVVNGDEAEPIAHIGVAEQTLTAVDVDPVTAELDVAFRPVREGPTPADFVPTPEATRWEIAADGRTLLERDPREDEVVIEGIEHGVAAIGDFNGDGAGDLAMGSSQSPGVVTVLLGGPGSGRIDLAKAREEGRAFDLVADDDCCKYLRKIAPAGDVDGDGLADLVITAASVMNNDEVRTYVVLGRKTIGDASLSSVERGEGGFTIRGGPAATWAHEVTGVGDVDGDGLDDIAIGDWGVGRSHVYVVYGKKDQEWIHLGDAERGVGGFVLRSEHDDDHLGIALSGIPDVDGDGKDELAIGAPGWAYDRGRVWVVRGASRLRAGPRKLEDLAASGQAVAISGAESDDRFGARILGSSNDAYGLVVAATKARGGDSESGKVYVVSRGQVLDPPNIEALVTIDGEFADDRLGHVLAVDADGLLVGSASARRYGAAKGGLWRVSGSQLEAVALPEGLGDFVEAVTSPDVDGDGHSDVIARMHDRGRASAVVVVLGPAN